MDELTHRSEEGRPRMVGVGDKDVTRRLARARGRLHCAAGTYEAVQEGDVPKGDVFEVARVAGVMAAKRTPATVPLCHPVRLTDIDVRFRLAGTDGGRGAIGIEAEVEALDRTGVEMEALSAVAAAALTLYDMIKGLDRSAEITDIRLVAKEGGKSGAYAAAAATWDDDETI